VPCSPVCEDHSTCAPCESSRSPSAVTASLYAPDTSSCPCVRDAPCWSVDCTCARRGPSSLFADSSMAWRCCASASVSAAFPPVPREPGLSTDITHTTAKAEATAAARRRARLRPLDSPSTPHQPPGQKGYQRRNGAAACPYQQLGWRVNAPHGYVCLSVTALALPRQQLQDTFLTLQCGRKGLSPGREDA
jgi:hypothetical protein